METLPLNLFDLVPKETAFTLSTTGEKKFTLCKWTLRVRAWAVTTYGSAGLKELFEKQDIQKIADVAFFMLKEKDDFGGNTPEGRDNFLDAISTLPDQLSVINALLGAVGIGEPERKKVSDAMDDTNSLAAQAKGAANPAPKSPTSKTKTGAKSSTPSRPATTTRRTSSPT